ncbi:thiol-disulfide oxidoreductase DCC family protein [Haloarcula amylolytica]|uniref:thiol-disulfide oxidoreductase DCC family protein n=1 Tax=Haloarcula amylolytica TaxID=396317 RepID=UPI003C764209
MSDATLVYDDDCGFCTWWADFIDERSDLEIVGFSELGDDLLERLPDDYESCSHLVTEEEVYSCGESIETALTYTDMGKPARPLVSFFRQFEDYERLRERAYRQVADNRSKWGKLMSKTPPARRDDSN